MSKLERELSGDDQKYITQDDQFLKLKTQNEELERALEKRGASAVVDYEEKSILSISEKKGFY